jgi:hypothetical protein
MSDDQRKCPYCGMAMAADQRACPDCGNPYPFDDDAPTLDMPPPPTRPGRQGGPASAAQAGGAAGFVARYKTVLVLVGVLVLIVAVGYLLFRIGMSFFEARRPDPSSITTAPAGPVLVPPTLSAPGSPAPGASPSPGTGGTVISPAASPSPSASPGVKLKVANTDSQGANMRQRPSTTAPILRTLPEGTVVEAIGGETNAEGRSWRNVRDPGGATGWVASELLVPE